MKLRITLATIAAALSIGWGTSAWANCSGPAAPAGRVMYAGNLNVMVFCDGANGVSMAGGVSSSTNIGGSSATPAGSANQVQYNNGSAFAGDSGLTWNGTTLTATNFAGVMTTAA